MKTKAKKAKAKKPVKAVRKPAAKVSKKAKAVAVKKVQAAPVGLKIEKDREERNGVTRPSIGGICRSIWDACDAMRAATLGSPTVREIKEHANLKGWNLTTTTIQFYKWREFHGIKSTRGKKA